MTASAGERRLRLLFLSQRFLLPMDSGGTIRTGKILERLNTAFDITLISNVDDVRDREHLGGITALCAAFRPVRNRQPKKGSLQYYLLTLARMFSRYPVAVLNDFSRPLEAELHAALRGRRYDLLVCDFLQPSLNFRRITGYPTLLFQHNVESVILKRRAELSSSSLSKLVWKWQARKMERYEERTCRKFSGVVTVSELDKQILETRFAARNVFAIPTGVDIDYFTPIAGEPERDSLVFTGSMDWFPNEDAILFFGREILPRIRSQIPGIKLTVVGRKPSRSLLTRLQDYPGIHAVGWVDDVRPYIARAMIYVIPLRIGGGTRIKTYEAMAMGKPVVSTPLGAEGLPVMDGEHIMLAGNAEEFAHAVITLLRHREEREKMGNGARDFVVRNFSWDKVAADFAEICRRVQTNAARPA